MPLPLRKLLPKKIYRQVFFSFLLVCILILSIVGLTTNLANQSVNSEAFQTRITTTTHLIQYYDEVLTMSARMSAFTGDTNWNRRYRHHVTMLDEQLKEVVIIYPKSRIIIQRISTANDQLVQAEENALVLSAKGQLHEAQTLLFNPDYEENKKIYMAGIKELISQLNNQQIQNQKDFYNLFFLTILAFIILLGLLGFIIWKMIYVLIQHIELENMLAVITKKLQAPHNETIDEDIRWSLKLFAHKARADYIFLIKKRKGKYTSIISEWGITTTPQCDEVHYNKIANLAANIEVSEDHTDTTEPSDEFKELGLVNILCQTKSTDTREYFQLCLINPKKKELNWDKKDASILSWFTDIIIRALDAIDKTHKLQLLAERDSLTNLLNRRKFIEILTQEWDQYCRYQTPYILMMLDIDHFKDVNDTYGHAAGDHVLADIAAIMKHCVRAVDVIGRLGGEEFSILLPGTDIKEAFIIADRIREQIQTAAIFTEGKIINTTISIGITLFTNQDKSSTEVLSRADKALYQAKQSGRNKVVSVQ